MGIVTSLLFRASAGLESGFEVTMLKDLAISAGFLFMSASVGDAEGQGEFNEISEMELREHR